MLCGMNKQFLPTVPPVLPTKADHSLGFQQTPKLLRAYPEFLTAFRKFCSNMRPHKFNLLPRTKRQLSEKFLNLCLISSQHFLYIFCYFNLKHLKSQYFFTNLVIFQRFYRRFFRALQSSAVVF